MLRYSTMILVLGLTACSGDKDDTAGGTGDTGNGGGTTPPACDTSCTDYCTTFLANCSADASNTYADQGACEATCAGFTCGTAADTTGDTLGCRAYHAGAAATDAATHCPHAAENPSDQCI